MHYLYAIIGWLLVFIGAAWSVFAFAGGGVALPAGDAASFAILGRIIAAAPGLGVAGFGLLLAQLAGIGIELADIRRSSERAADDLEAIRRDQLGQ